MQKNISNNAKNQRGTSISQPAVVDEPFCTVPRGQSRAVELSLAVPQSWLGSTLIRCLSVTSLPRDHHSFPSSHAAAAPSLQSSSIRTIHLHWFMVF